MGLRLKMKVLNGKTIDASGFKCCACYDIIFEVCKALKKLGLLQNQLNR